MTEVAEDQRGVRVLVVKRLPMRKEAHALVRQRSCASYFPGYGWLFVDDEGFANIGLGYAYDKKFPLRLNVRRTLLDFIDRDLGPMLRNATRCGKISGGAAAFYRPNAIVGDRVLLVGDAANQADPLNGGGIHKAMEGASLAAAAALYALSSGDFSAAALGVYEQLWQEHLETDWKTAEFFLSVAKNPALRDFCLYLLTQIGLLTTEDPRFEEFASGVFSGTIAQSVCLSPMALYRAFPKSPETWLALLRRQGHGVARGSAMLVGGAADSLAKAAVRIARDPVRNLDWGLEIAANAVALAERGVSGPTRTAAINPGQVCGMSKIVDTVTSAINQAAGELIDNQVTTKLTDAATTMVSSSLAIVEDLLKIVRDQPSSTES